MQENLNISSSYFPTSLELLERQLLEKLLEKQRYVVFIEGCNAQIEILNREINKVKEVLKK